MRNRLLYLSASSEDDTSQDVRLFKLMINSGLVQPWQEMHIAIYIEDGF